MHRRIIDVNHAMLALIQRRDGVLGASSLEEFASFRRILQHLEADSPSQLRGASTVALDDRYFEVRSYELAEDAVWQPVEVFVRARSAAEFTHRICPACCDVLYPETEV